MNSDTAATWHAVYTHPHREVKAELNLRRQGFTCYLPRYQKVRRHARRTEKIAAPLFPRYLFVAFDRGSQRWWSIRSTVGVFDILMNGEHPAVIPSGVVKLLKSREDAHGFISLPQRQRFVAGDGIRVVNGAFSSCLGLFEGMVDRERVAVLVDLLGRKVRVVMNEDLLALA